MHPTEDAVYAVLLQLGCPLQACFRCEARFIRLLLQGNLAWVEPILNGTTPAARKGASAACTQNRFVVIFGGKGVDADAKEVMKDDLLLLEMEGGPLTLKVSSLDIKGLKPAPRMNASSRYVDGPQTA